jgi:hypothetical protein
LNIISIFLNAFIDLPFGDLLTFSTITFTILFSLPTITPELARKDTPIEMLHFISWIYNNPMKVIIIAAFYLLSALFDLIFLISKILLFGALCCILALFATFATSIIIMGCIKGAYKMKKTIGHQKRLRFTYH